MRILQINTSIARSSVGRLIELLGHEIIRQGDEVAIAHGHRYGGPTGLPHIPIGHIADEYIHALQARLCDSDGLGSVRATRNLLREIDTFSPDIIHLHNLHGYYLNYRLLTDYIARHNIPTVITLHDLWLLTGHCSHPVDGCEKWKYGCHACSGKSVYPASLTDASERNHAAKIHAIAQIPDLHVTAVSQWVADMARQSLLLKRRPLEISVIHNGIDTGIFRPLASDIRIRYGIGDRHLILGCALPFNTRKGFEDFIKLRTLLSGQYAIALVGVNHRQARQLTRNGIIAIGSVESDMELAQWYSEADVFANPTYYEALSCTNIEAQACGTPVVTYQTGGCPETVCASTGMTVERGDVPAMAKAIEQVCDAGKASYTESCRRRAVEMFDYTTFTSKYLNLYSRILGDNII